MKLFKPLRHRMDDMDIQQQDLAALTGISASTLSTRIRGVYPFTAWEMKAIGRALGIPPEEYHRYFFDGDDPNAVKSGHAHRFTRAV